MHHKCDTYQRLMRLPHHGIYATKRIYSTVLGFKITGITTATTTYLSSLGQAKDIFVIV